MAKIEKYIPCPVCHDLGAGGRIVERIYDRGKSIYTCRNCHESWDKLDSISWRTGLQYLTRLEQAGLYVRNPSDDRKIERFDNLKLFNIDDRELQQWVQAALEKGIAIPKRARGKYYQYDTQKPIGSNGERVLIVYQIDPENIVAFPSHNLVEPDFHW